MVKCMITMVQIVHGNNIIQELPHEHRDLKLELLGIIKVKSHFHLNFQYVTKYSTERGHQMSILQFDFVPEYRVLGLIFIQKSIWSSQFCYRITDFKIES